MPSLREIVMRTSPAQRACGTGGGTSLEQVEQARSLFHLVREEDSDVEQAFSQKSANTGPCSSVPFPRERNSGTSNLSAEIEAGLGRLHKSRCPHYLNSTRWPAVVADAMRLGSDGWASKGLALGWSPLDLFGAVTNAQGDPYSDGLAVKLAGRPIVAMCAKFATVDLGNGGRAFLHRATNDGARLLWELTNQSKVEGQ